MGKRDDGSWWRVLLAPASPSGPWRLRFATPEQERQYRQAMHCRTLADMTPAEIQALEQTYRTRVLLM